MSDEFYPHTVTPRLLTITDSNGFSYVLSVFTEADLDEYRASLIKSVANPQAITDVMTERDRQQFKGYDAAHDDGHTLTEFTDFMAERIRRAENQMQAGYVKNSRKNLVEVAALAVAAIEAQDRIFSRAAVPSGDIFKTDVTVGVILRAAKSFKLGAMSGDAFETFLRGHLQEKKE